MPPPADRTTASDSRRVLIIDDEQTIRLALRRFFTRMGWAVDEASNGESGYSLIALDEQVAPAERYQLVICDLRMPGLNGIELHARLRDQHPGVLKRLVISTGDIVSQEAASFLENAGCEVLQKPFELSVLRETAQRLSDAAAATS